MSGVAKTATCGNPYSRKRGKVPGSGECGLVGGEGQGGRQGKTWVARSRPVSRAQRLTVGVAGAKVAAAAIVFHLKDTLVVETGAPLRLRTRQKGGWVDLRKGLK